MGKSQGNQATDESFFYVSAYLIKVRQTSSSQCIQNTLSLFPSQSFVDDKDNWCLFYVLLLASCIQ